jgi:hypothetical protein
LASDKLAEDGATVTDFSVLDMGAASRIRRPRNLNLRTSRYISNLPGANLVPRREEDELRTMVIRQLRQPERLAVHRPRLLRLRIEDNSFYGSNAEQDVAGVAGITTLLSKRKSPAFASTTLVLVAREQTIIDWMRGQMLSRFGGISSQSVLSMNVHRIG